VSITSVYLHVAVEKTLAKGGSGLLLVTGDSGHYAIDGVYALTKEINVKPFFLG